MRSRTPPEAGRFRRWKLAPRSDYKNSTFALVLVLRAKGRSLLFVTRQRILYDLERGVGRPDVLYLDLFAFELFVVLEETPQNEQAVRRPFVRFASRV